MISDGRYRGRTVADRFREAGVNEVIEEELKTSERVLKRVTDGIYRQPSSALRELISNSYDADATHVEVATDAPRFDVITVRDNGNGLTYEALAALIHSIGGSSKRRTSGINLGVCSESDPTRSPGGRKLIGKIGIGLFSVSQLTKHFQIITKTRGTNYRIYAEVKLHTHMEDFLIPHGEDEKTGSVRMWKVPAQDTESHGTEVILRNLLQRTKDELSSKRHWEQCLVDDDSEFPSAAAPPKFHIGYDHVFNGERFFSKKNLPWLDSDSCDKKFRKLVNGLQKLRGSDFKNPSVHDHLDYYLRMLWALSLSLPLNYIDVHPFDLYRESGVKVFRVGNKPTSRAEEIVLDDDKSIRDVMKFVSPERGVTTSFDVYIDGVKLLRPIEFRGLEKTLESVPFSLLFVGKDQPDLSSIPKEFRGGDLEFEAYLFWNHVVVPKEQAGVLVRVNDANGTLFDDTFLGYQVSEQRRKTQVTAEIFVTKGLDPALNIDRESFNTSHPHYQYLARWLHNAFKQFATRHKAMAKEIREQGKVDHTIQQINEIERTVRETLLEDRHIESDEIAVVEFHDDSTSIPESRRRGVVALEVERVMPDISQDGRRHVNVTTTRERWKSKIAAVAQILDAYGLLNGLDYDDQHRLLHAIVKVFGRE